MNDNLDPRIEADVMAWASGLGLQIDPGIIVLLESLNVPRDARLAVKDYLGDVTANLNQGERKILGLLRAPKVADLFRSAVQPVPQSLLENYAEEFERLATNPAQVQLAASFKALVDGMARGRQPDRDDGPER